MRKVWAEPDQHATVREGAPDAFERLKEWRRDVATQEFQDYRERVAKISEQDFSEKGEPAGCLPALLALLLP